MMKKGFTLIELLVVIAILAVLSTVAVLVLNPAQILAESRDVQRLADLDSVRSAIALTLTSATGTVTLDPDAQVSASSTTGCPFAPAICVVVSSLSVDGTGWAGVNLNQNSGGSPLAVLPRDPRNDDTYFYGYNGDDSQKTFELNGRLESVKHRGKMAEDGGNQNTCTGSYIDTTCFYEVGTDPGLDLQ